MIKRLWAWLGDCPLWDLWRRRGKDIRERVPHLDTLTDGTMHYHNIYAFARGTTAQEVSIAAMASAAIWTARDPNAGRLSEVTLTEGTYRVEVDATIRYHPVEEGEAIPVFDGKVIRNLLHHIDRSGT